MLYVSERAREQGLAQKTSAGTGAAMVYSFALRIPAFKLKSAANRLVPAKYVVSTVHGTRTVLLDARSGHYWGLDEVGSRIWTLAQEGLSCEQMAVQLSEEYDAPIDRLRHDVRNFLARLRASRLVEPS